MSPYYKLINLLTVVNDFLIDKWSGNWNKTMLGA